MGVEFDMPVGMSVLSVFLAFFFSFLAIQCTGVTGKHTKNGGFDIFADSHVPDITPLTAASKASQIVLGGATKGEGWGVAHAQKLNLLGGALANMGANQSTDLTTDFRVGFLLRTPPIQQWIAQGLGTIVAVFLAPGMFVLFATAYPCILDTEAEHCAFSGPSVSAWRAVAIAVTDPAFPIPTSSGIFAICFSIFGVAMVLVRHFVWVGKLEWVRAYHPNIMCVSLAFVLPQSKLPSKRMKTLSPSCTLNTRADEFFSCLRSRHDHGSPPRIHLGQAEPQELRHLWLRDCSWPHRWRGYWWCRERHFPDRWHLRRFLRKQHCLPW